MALVLVLLLVPALRSPAAASPVQRVALPATASAVGPGLSFAPPCSTPAGSAAVEAAGECLHTDALTLSADPNASSLQTASATTVAPGPQPLRWTIPDDDAATPRPDWDVQCHGTGGDGKRLRLFFYRADDQPPLDDARLQRIQRVAEDVDRTFFLSAEARGEGRRVRWLTSAPLDGVCHPLVREVTGPPGSTFGAPGRLEALMGAGVSADPRFLDVVFIDGDAGDLAGYAEFADDDRTGSDNANMLGARYAGLFRLGWNQYTAAHEIAHLLGAVQASAPHHADGRHCNDGYEVLCHATGEPHACPLPPRRAYGYLDCGGDDYYHPSPALGSYLSRHWNTADSPFLERQAAVGDPPATRITSGAGVVLPYTRFALTAEDSTPAGVFSDPSVRRWQPSSGCHLEAGNASTTEGYCGAGSPGSRSVEVGHLVVDRFDRDAVDTVSMTVQTPDVELPAMVGIEVDRSVVQAGDRVQVTATYLGQAPGQTAPTTPLVGAAVELRQDGVAAGGYGLQTRRGSTDRDGRFTATFTVLESSTLVAGASAYGAWRTAQARSAVQVQASSTPVAPRRVAAEGKDRAAVLSWQEPAGGLQAGTEAWEVLAEDGVVAARVPAAARSAEVRGLANGHARRFAVRAVVNGVSGTPTEQVTATPLGPPSAPRSPVAWTYPQEVQVSWLPPNGHGGGSDVQYEVRLDPVGTVTQVSRTEMTRFRSLENGKPYTVSVRARHPASATDPRSSDWGPWSPPSASVVPVGVPDAPVDVRAVAGDRSATISWEEPAWDGGAAITQYLVTDVATGRAIYAGGPDARSVTWPQLENGTSYQFAVQAFNRAGVSPSSAVSAPVVPRSPTGGPTPEEDPPAGQEPAPSPTPSPSAQPPPAPSPSPISSPGPGSGGGPGPRAVDDSCPEGAVPRSEFLDTAGTAHAFSIDCVAWWQLAAGRTATEYAPGAPVTREAMAAFVARAVRRAGGALPDSPADAFIDDGASVHQRAINELAAVGLVRGSGEGRYAPLAVVSRAQMATFLAGAAAHVRGSALPPGTDQFSDDDGSPFELDIDRVAAAGLTGGTHEGSFSPLAGVTRGQMASFLSRLLDLYVEEGWVRPPAP